MSRCDVAYWHFSDVTAKFDCVARLPSLTLNGRSVGVCLVQEMFQVANKIWQCLNFRAGE
jgi:hypothetical protein